MRVARKLELDGPTERKLRVWFKHRRALARIRQRAWVIPLAAKGWQNEDLATEVKLARRQVARWR
jgi:hypothetical protein